MSTTLSKVQAIIAEALYLDLEEVTPDASLMRDLGAESIDFLDIVFRLEKSFGVKIPKGEIERRARGGLSEEEFAVNGKLTADGLAALRRTMTEVDASAFKEGLGMRDIPALFTVRTFERLVSSQLAAAGAAQRPAVPAGIVRPATAAATSGISRL